MKKILALLTLCTCLQLTGNEISTWSSPPDTISTLGLNSSNPCTAVDGNGNVVAIWLENDVVISKNLVLNTSWSAPTTLSGTGASSPQLTIDPAGNATAIWVESGIIKTKTQPFGSAWSSVTTLSASGSSSPQIAADSSGNVVAVWVTSGVVQSATRIFNGTWSGSPDVLSSSGSAAPQVAINSNGTAVAIWHTLNGVTSLHNVNSARKVTIGGSWSAPTTVSDPTENSVYPQVAMESDGDAVAVWYNYDVVGSAYFNVVLNVACYPSGGGGGWSLPVGISSPGIRNPENLTARVIINTENVVALWTNSYDGSTLSLETSQAVFKGVWAPPIVLATNIYCYTLDTSLSSIGDILSVYMSSDTNSTPIVINYIESHAGGFSSGFWTSPFVISNGDENAFPRISTTINNQTNIYGTAVWVGFDGSNNVIQTSQGTGIAVIPPTNLTVVQNATDYGVFTEYYNVLSWTASTEPNLNVYGIYQNGTFIKFVQSNVLQYIDHNAVQNGPVVYGVTTIDTSGTESAIVTVSFP